MWNVDLVYELRQLYAKHRNSFTADRREIDAVCRIISPLAKIRVSRVSLRLFLILKI
jgi:hypothetical protein